MTIGQSIILGIVQGLTEFLPISSSGHLIILPKIFDWNDQGLAFDAFIHLATALAIIVALRKEIKTIINSFNLKRQDSQMRNGRKLAGLIGLAIIPAGLVGLFLDNFIEAKLRMVEVVAWSLILWGIVLAWAEYYNHQLKDKHNLENVNWEKAIVVGLMQVIAFIPGSSRSGVTITGGLFCGMSKKAAVQFSFLIGWPLILAAGVLKFYELIKVGEWGEEIFFLTAGFMNPLFIGNGWWISSSTR